MKIDLRHGDCIQVMQSLEEGLIDMVITDPPYGMDFQSNRAKDGPRHEKIENDAVIDPAWIYESYRLLKVGGGLVMTCDWNTSCEWRVHLETAGFEIKSQVIWNRMHHGMGDLAGAFAPMHDVIWYAVKGRRIFVNGRPKSVIGVMRPSPSEDHGHPTCKPVALMEKLITATSDGSNGFILDPFMGSGSTGVAAKNLNRDFIGIEMVEKYFKTASARIESTNGLFNFFEATA